MTSYAESYAALVKEAITKREELKKELRENHARACAAELEAAQARADVQIRSALEAFGSGKDHWTPSAEFLRSTDVRAQYTLFDEVERLTGSMRRIDDDGDAYFDFSVTLY